MDLLLGLGIAFCLGATVIWRLWRRATERTLKDHVEKLSAASARAEEDRSHLLGRVTLLEAERDLIAETLRQNRAPVQPRCEGNIVQFSKIEECGTLIGPKSVPISFDLKGVSQRTWDVLQSAEGRNDGGSLRYLEPIPVTFQLRVASRRWALLVATDIEIREPYDRVEPPKQLPQHPERQKPGYSVDWRSGGTVERL